MSDSRSALDAALDRLEAQVAEWVTHLREPRLFRRQFDALADQVCAQAGADELAYVHMRLHQILARHAPPGVG